MPALTYYIVVDNLRLFFFFFLWIFFPIPARPFDTLHFIALGLHLFHTQWLNANAMHMQQCCQSNVEIQIQCKCHFKCLSLVSNWNHLTSDKRQTYSMLLISKRMKKYQQWIAQRNPNPIPIESSRLFIKKKIKNPTSSSSLVKSQWIQHRLMFHSLHF